MGQRVETAGRTVELPGWLQPCRAMPDDPPGSLPFLYQIAGDTGGSTGLVTVSPLAPEQTMPFGEARAVIDGIHECLGDDQGLVEVKATRTRGGEPVIWSIVKTTMEPSGVQYFLMLHLATAAGPLCVRGFFDEAVATGMRDTLVAARGYEGPWRADPYDPSFTRGNLMNQSEAAEWDAAFPAHPLSKARELARHVVEHN